MFERFTDRARRVLVLAQEEARLLEHNFIGTEHILLGLISEREGVAARALASLGVSLEVVRQMVSETIGPSGSDTAGSPPFTPRAKKVLELSLREALQLGHNYIGTEHMLLGLVREGEGVAAQVLADLGAQPLLVRQRVIEVLSGAVVKDLLAAVDPEAVTPTDLPVEPSTLVTWEDVEAVMRREPMVTGASARDREASAVKYRTHVYSAHSLPQVSISVAGAKVSREAFDDFAAGRGSEVTVPDLGDAATYNSATGSLRVLSSSVLFVVTVEGAQNGQKVAVALAERALERLEGASPPAENDS